MYQYDSSRVGMARRQAIEALDEYDCTVAECCGMFDASPATFHRYADGVRLRRRPTVPDVLPMTPKDATELATIALLRARFTATEIVEALRRTSKSAVYRQWEALKARRGDLSPAEARMLPRHLPSQPGYGDERPVEKRRAARWRRERWVTRGRVPVGT